MSQEAKEVDIEEYSKWAANYFSGVISIDEAHDSRGGKKEYLIIASDPLSKRRLKRCLLNKKYLQKKKKVKL